MTILDREELQIKPFTNCVLFGPRRQQRCPTDLWLAGAYSNSPLQPLNEIDETWHEVSTQCLWGVAFEGRTINKDDRPGLREADSFYVFSATEWNLTNLTGILLCSLPSLLFWTNPATKANDIQLHDIITTFFVLISCQVSTKFVQRLQIGSLTCRPVFVIGSPPPPQ